MPTIFRRDLDNGGFSRCIARANRERADLATVLCSGWNNSLAQVLAQRDDCE
jgi:hypothetical protein